MAGPVPSIVVVAKLGSIIEFIVVLISFQFVNFYSGYRPQLRERIFWALIVFVPVLVIIFSNYYMENIIVERYTIFGEKFFGVALGQYNLLGTYIRPIAFLFLFYRLVKAKNNEKKDWFVLVGFLISALFSVNDKIANMLSLTWIRLNDYSFIFLGIGYTLAMVRHYYSLYNNMETLVEERTIELKRSEELYRKLVTTVPDLIIRTDLAGNILFINETVFPFIENLPAENILGKNILSFVATEDRNKATRNLQQMLNSSLGLQEYRLNYENENKLYCEINGEVLLDTNGNPFGMVFVLRDISERKKSEEIISSSLKEKEVLLKEIYHRTKNNMQVICSIIGLQTPSLKDPQAINILKETENRIYAMSLVHQKLYQSNNLSRIDLKTYIADLCDQLKSSYELYNRRIALTLDLESVTVLIDTAIPVGLIINELVTNSLKYAFPNSDEGKIEITLRYENEEILLQIKDNGVGIAGNFEVAESKTLGLKILYELVNKQLNGSIKMSTDNGVTCLITFKETLYTERV